jgi:hypothetical protein
MLVGAKGVTCCISFFNFVQMRSLEKKFSPLQKGAWIVVNGSEPHDNQWACMVVEQIYSEKFVFTNGRHGINFFYEFRHGHQSIKESLGSVATKIESDQIRPLVSAGASQPPVWSAYQWEKTSKFLQRTIAKETMSALSTFVKLSKESSAHVTVR